MADLLNPLNSLSNKQDTRMWQTTDRQKKLQWLQDITTWTADVIMLAVYVQYITDVFM